MGFYLAPTLRAPFDVAIVKVTSLAMSTRWRASTKSRARSNPEALQDDGQGTEPRKSRLHQIKPDERGQEQLHLGLATLSIVALIALAIGWRDGLTVLIVIPTTILLTLFASWLLGYTINRVSLFALIFSIGILVDDAIVVIENIARHCGLHDGV
jgi:predicted exporter